MQRRSLLVLVPGFLAAPAWPQAPVLALYGLPLKDADLTAFLSAARAVGAVPVAPSGTPSADTTTLDTRNAGVPALQRMTVSARNGRVLQVQFLVKAYGEDNQALRRALLDKYGPPLTVSPRPLPFGGFGATAAPRGAFQWRFAEGMVLVWQHPRLGDVTLTYLDESKTAPPAETPAAAGELRNRF